MQTALISHPSCLQHQMIDGHPEGAERLRAIDDQLMAQRLFDFLDHHEAPLAKRRDLLRVHTKQHVDYLFATAPAKGQKLAHIDPDTFMNHATLEAALRAAGAGILATDLVLRGKVKTAFCNVRPPGHHAEHDRAMGFCFFNNVAVAAAYALSEYRLERVAIVDFDVHHGNGTEDIFRDEPRVLMCSTYQHPFYPYSGGDTVPGHLINVTLPAGSAGPEFRCAVQQRWLPALDQFKPQLIYISAGFDAHWEDDMAGLQLNESDYAWVTRKMMAVADAFCDGRIVSLLEGGYALHALGRSAAEHIRALMRVD